MMLALLTSVLFTSPAFAANGSSGNTSDPLSQIDIVKNNKQNVSEDSIYKDANNILYLIYFIAGFISVVSMICAGVLLGTSGSNPNRRAGGFVALGMALLGSWVLYKAVSLSQWVGKFGETQ